MYHCRIQLYFFNCQSDFVMTIEESIPPAHFQYKYVKSNQLEREKLAESDVILADLQEMDVKEVLQTILLNKKKDAEVILLADKAKTAEIMTCNLSEITDIWTLPLAREEITFHFKKWQQIYKAKKELWLTKNYLDTTINSVPHLIWYKDKEGAHIKVNNSFCKAVNKTMEQIEGRGHYYIWDIDPDEYAKGEFICMESEYEVMDKRETCVFDENVKIGEDMRMLKTYKSPLFDLDGSVMGTVGVAIDVTQENTYKQMIINNANTDFLTKLYNRRYVYEYIEKNKGLPLTIFYLDLDNFKGVNDKYGHHEGDRALLAARDILMNCMPDDTIARIGGDEFLAIRLGKQTEQEIEETRLYLQKQLDENFARDAHFANVSASIGTAYSAEGNIAMDVLIRKADAIMYREKYRKKN